MNQLSGAGRIRNVRGLTAFLGLLALALGVAVARPAFGQAIPPTTIQVTVDRGQGGIYLPGQTIEVCVLADTRVGSEVRDYSPLVRLIDLPPNGSRIILYEGQVAGRYCYNGSITPPLGTETIRAEYIVCGIGGCNVPGVVNSSEVSFQVVAIPPPPATSTPAPTAAVTASPTAQATATPPPSPTPLPGRWLDRPLGSPSAPTCPTADQWLLLYWGGGQVPISDAALACRSADVFWTRRGTAWLGYFAAASVPGANDDFSVPTGEAMFVRGMR